MSNVTFEVSRCLVSELRLHVCFAPCRHAVLSLTVSNYGLAVHIPENMYDLQEHLFQPSRSSPTKMVVVPRPKSSSARQCPFACS